VTVLLAVGSPTSRILCVYLPHLADERFFFFPSPQMGCLFVCARSPSGRFRSTRALLFPFFSYSKRTLTFLFFPQRRPWFEVGGGGAVMDPPPPPGYFPVPFSGEAFRFEVDNLFIFPLVFPRPLCSLSGGMQIFFLPCWGTSP